MTYHQSLFLTGTRSVLIWFLKHYGQWTRKGKSELKLLDKRQITGVMCGSLVGELLPFQLVYVGKTSRCHPAYEFPKD